jgi:hypothetical protein
MKQYRTEYVLTLIDGDKVYETSRPYPREGEAKAAARKLRKRYAKLGYSVKLQRRRY